MPSALRERLDARLISGGFSGYVQLAEWLDAEGYEVSHATVHRYGQQLERKVEAIKLATEQAKAICTASPDEEGAVSVALIRMAQERLFRLLNEAGDDADMKEVATAARAVADMARAGVSVASERRKILKEAAETAAKSAESAARDAGHHLPPEVLARIRREVYGIHDA